MADPADKTGLPMEENAVAKVVAKRPADQEDEPSDNSLLRRFKTGSDEAAAMIYARYAGRLKALATKKCSSELSRCLEADDIVQSVFRRFFHKANRGLYDVPQGEDLWNLLVVIALNKIRSEEGFYRASKRDLRRSAGPQDLSQYAESSQPEPAEDVLLRLTVEEAMQRLSPADRVVVELRMEGHKVAAIAERTLRSKRTVERVLQEALKKFNTYFHEESRDESDR